MKKSSIRANVVSKLLKEREETSDKSYKSPTPSVRKSVMLKTVLYACPVEKETVGKKM